MKSLEFLQKSQDKAGRAERAGDGIRSTQEEPFTIARDSLGFKVYLMKWNKGRKDCTVEIEEI